MTAGAPAGGASPAPAVMAPCPVAAGQAGRAGRAGLCTGGGERLIQRAMNFDAHPAGDELIKPDGLAADHVEHIACDPAGGCGDDGAEVGLLDQCVDVDARDDVIQVHPAEQAVQVDPVHHPVDVDLLQHGVQINLVQQLIHIQRGNHKIYSALDAAWAHASERGTSGLASAVAQTSPQLVSLLHAGLDQPFRVSRQIRRVSPERCPERFRHCGGVTLGRPWPHHNDAGSQTPVTSAGRH